MKKKLHSETASAATKTWLAGWATNRRLHSDEVCGCLFGGGECGEDSLPHYVRCPSLAAAFKVAMVLDAERSGGPKRQGR